MAAHRNFLSMQPPPNYVAGVGRGAVGFTTTPDLGSVKEGANEELIQAAIKQRAKAVGLSYGNEENIADEEVGGDDDFGLFAGGRYDREDEEADNIWNSIEENMAKRHQKKREENNKQSHNKNSTPPVSTQFSDLKRDLGTVSVEEWAAIPEAGDLTRKNKRSKIEKKQLDRSYQIPDTLLTSAKDLNKSETVLSDGQLNNTRTDFTQMGQARDMVLSLSLDKKSSDKTTLSVSTIDPKGYLTSLDSLSSPENVSDVKKARLLMESIVQTNSSHAPGWIALARLEEYVGRINTARKVIMQGMENCTTNEDIYLEAVRLEEKSGHIPVARSILATAVINIPKSTKLWIKAMNLETSANSKKKIVRKALEIIPNSINLWKEAVSLEEDPNDAKLLLSRAIEILPESVELWLALARLETYSNAKKVLNNAQKAIPTSHDIWIAAARLEEDNKNFDNVIRIIKLSIKKLGLAGALPTREQWISQAELCERESGIHTAQAIIACSISLDIESDELLDTLSLDASAAIERGSFVVARAIYAYALQHYSNEYTLWREAAELEKAHGSSGDYFALLERAVQACPHSEILWLMGAKEYWINGNIQAARQKLSEAFEKNPNSEDIWIAAIKVEFENEEIDRARILLTRARDEAGTERIWVKSVAFERQTQNNERALELIQEGCQKYPKSSRLWMMKGQIFEDMGLISDARNAYASGMRECAKDVDIWILAAVLEIKQNLYTRARAIIDRARLQCPGSQKLWYFAVQMELKAGNEPQAKIVMSRALQEFPNSGLLWSLAILLEPRSLRKNKSADALRKAGNSAEVITTVARIFWDDRKIEKARNWFEKAIKVDPDNGDIWAWYYKYLSKEGSEEDRKNLESRVQNSDPRHGCLWPKILKAPSNFRMKASDIMRRTAEKLELWNFEII